MQYRTQTWTPQGEPLCETIAAESLTLAQDEAARRRWGAGCILWEDYESGPDGARRCLPDRRRVLSGHWQPLGWASAYEEQPS